MSPGRSEDPALRPYRLRNANGLEAEVIRLGATLVRLRAPDRAGRLGDVVLGFAEHADYHGRHPALGSTVGRFANRIGGACFALDGRRYVLAANDGPHHLHGSFGHATWDAEPVAGGAGVRLCYRSPAGEEGYPGTLDVETTFRLGDDDALHLEWRATTDAPTVVNLTNHAYWNLEDGGASPILDHELWLAASRYAPVDRSGLPTGELVPVRDTPFDFTTPRRIGERMAALLGSRGGYDHPFALDTAGDLGAPAARLVAPHSRRALEVRTTQLALQLYTGNFLDGTIHARAGARPRRWHALSLETQGFPNAPNEPRFPSARLDPGRVERGARLAHLRLHQLALELEHQLVARHAVAGIDVDALDDAGRARAHLHLALRLDRAGRDDDALDPPTLHDRARRRRVSVARAAGREQAEGETARATSWCSSSSAS